MVDIYTRKYNNFNEFCEYIQTPDEVGEWYVKNHVIWPKGENGSDHPFRWPDDIVKYKIGNCYDHGLFMYYFCKRKNIKVKIVHSYVVCNVNEENNTYQNFFGHITTLFEKDGMWYEFDPIIQKQKENRVIKGPFKTPDQYIEYMNECLKFFAYNNDLTYKPIYGIKFYTKKDEEVLDKYYNHPIKNRDIFTEKYISGGNIMFQKFKNGKIKPIDNNIYIAYLDYKTTFLKFVIQCGINQAKKKISSLIENLPLKNLLDIKEGVDVNMEIEKSEYLDKLNEFYMLSNRDDLHQKFVDGLTEMFVLTDLYVNKQKSIYYILEDAPSQSVSIGAKKTVTQRNTVGVGSSFTNFLRKIMQFLQNMMEDFSEKAKRLIEDDVEWLNRVNATFENIPDEVAKSLTITVVPWHNRQVINRLQETKIKMAADLEKLIVSIGQAKEIKLDRVYQDVFPDFYKLNKKDWKAAALYYYRDGENATEVFKAEKAVEALKKMREYVMNYKKYSEKAKAGIKEQSKLFADIIKKIEKEESTNESFIIADKYSVLEESSLYNTEFIDILYEGVTSKEEPKEGDKPKEDSEKPEEKQKTVADTNKEEDKKDEQKTENVSDEEKKKDINEKQKTACKQIIKIMIGIISAKCTVAEEIARSYMKVLHQIYDGITKYNRDVNEDKKNTDYNTEVRHNKDVQSAERAKDNANKFKERAEKVGGAKLIGHGIKAIGKGLLGFLR